VSPWAIPAKKRGRKGGKKFPLRKSSYFPWDGGNQSRGKGEGALSPPGGEKEKRSRFPSSNKGRTPCGPYYLFPRRKKYVSWGDFLYVGGAFILLGGRRSVLFPPKRGLVMGPFEKGRRRRLSGSINP